MAQNQKCSLKLYSQFLVANNNRYSGLELEKVSPIDGMAHDSVTRLLSRSDFRPSDLWRCAKPMVTLEGCYLVGDDSVLDKSRSQKNELAKWQYSGAIHDQANGILWSICCGVTVWTIYRLTIVTIRHSLITKLKMNTGERCWIELKSEALSHCMF